MKHLPSEEMSTETSPKSLMLFVDPENGFPADAGNQPAERQIDSEDEAEDQTSSDGDVVEIEQGSVAGGSLAGQVVAEPDQNERSVEDDNSTQTTLEEKTECRAKKN